MTSLEAIDERFFYLQLHFGELMEKCNGDAEKEGIVNQQFTDASTCHDEALDKIFSENAAAVKALREGLASNTASLKQQMQDDAQIVLILDTLTAGGELAQELLDKGQ
jgi:hypothetical protein